MCRVEFLLRMRCQFRDFFFEDEAVREELALYYSSVRRADDCLNQVLRALKKSGEWDNTMIIFLSDHGMPLPFAKTSCIIIVPVLH